jgi:hypothetical protein
MNEYMREFLDGYADMRNLTEAMISLKGKIPPNELKLFKYESRDQETRPYRLGRGFYKKLNRSKLSDGKIYAYNCLFIIAESMKGELGDFLNNDPSSSKNIMVPDDY